MKHAFLFLLLSFSVGAFSQTEQFKVMLGGDVGFYFERALEEDAMGVKTKLRDVLLSANPRFGFFPAKRFMLGFQLPLNYQASIEKTGVLPKEKQSILQYGLGFFTRYYFHLKKNEKIALFPEVGVNLYRSVFKTSAGLASKQKRKEGFIGAGMAYFINPNLDVNLALSYHAGDRKTIQGKSLRNYLLFKVGFNAYFGKGKMPAKAE